MFILLVAAILDGVVVGGTALLLSNLAARRIRSSAKRTAVGVGLIAGAFVCFIYLFEPTAQLLWAGTVVEGVSVSRDEYRGIGPPLPHSAKRITYYSDWQGTDAVFSVSEETFLAWTTERGWQREEIQVAAGVQLMRLGMEPVVTDGIHVGELFHPRGTALTLLFDRTTGLCHYDYSSY